MKRKQRNYVAVIHKVEDSDYSIHFPDFDGCISAGDTFEEALYMGVEALELHIKGMLEDGDDIPVPSPADPAMADGDGVLALVSVRVPGRIKRYNLTLDENLVAEVDTVTKNRSAFFAEAARHELERRLEA